MVTLQFKFHFEAEFSRLKSQENWWNILQKQPELKNQFLVWKLWEEAWFLRGCCHTNFSSNYMARLNDDFISRTFFLLRNEKAEFYFKRWKWENTVDLTFYIHMMLHVCTLQFFSSHWLNFFYDFLMRESFLISISQALRE